MPGLDLPSVMESVKEFRASLQGRKRELLEPFGLDNLDKFKDDPAAFKDSVALAVDSFKEKKEQDAPYQRLHEDERCLVTFTSKPEGAAAAGSHLKIDDEVKCPWCICVKHPDNERWWKTYYAATLTFIYAKDDACCIVLTARDALDTLENRFAFSQVEGIENKGLKGNPEEQRKVLERLYGKTGLSDSSLVELLAPALRPMEEKLKAVVLAQNLLEALKTGVTERVKYFLDAGADVDFADEGGCTPLFWAAKTGKAEICKMLIKVGADVNAMNGSGWRPLSIAAVNGHLEICKLLIDAGADMDARDGNGCTPLHAALWEGQFEACKVLVEGGADVNATDNAGWSPLYWAAGKPHSEEACKLLIDAGADVDIQTERGNSPLLEAAFEGNLENCKVLIDAGADVNSRNRMEYTALLYAAERGNLEVCKLLLESGADVNAVGGDGKSPLANARHLHHREVEELLLRAGARG